VKRIPPLTVLALTLFGLALRLSGIGRLDFSYDEIVLRNYSLTGSALYTPTEPPLMAWLLAAVMSLTRRADALVMHSTVAWIGSMTIPFAYLLGARVSQNRTIGIVAALLTALSPMAIYYSREVRPYALLMLVSTAVYWTLLRANERNTLQAWSAYAVALCLCGLSHLVTMQIAAALGAFAVAQLAIPSLSTDAKDARLARFGRFAAFSLAAGLAGFVWFGQRYFTDPAIQANRGRIFGGGSYRYGVVGFLRDVAVNLGPGPFGQRFALARPDRADVFGLIVLALAAGGLWQLWKHGRRDVAALLGLSIGVPLAIEYFTLGEKSNWDWMRWMTHVLVPYLVVAAIGLHGMLGARFGWIASAAGVTAVAAMMAPNALHPLERPEYQQKRDIASYLRHNAPALRGVLVPPFYVEMIHPADQRMLETYYYLKQETLPVYVLSMGRIRKAVELPTRGHVALLPQESAEPPGDLSSGRYAVLTWQPAVDCGTMLRSISGPKALARRSSPVMPGLTICDVEFGSVPN